MDRTRWSKGVAVVAAITLSAGCGTSAAPSARPGPTAVPPSPQLAGSAAAGPVGPAVTLRFADAEDQGRNSQPWIDAFIARVAKDSGGSITIDPEYNAGGGNEGVPGEIIVAQQVLAGDVDLALVPVRAWNDAGVTSVQALEAPSLIDTDALFNAVATDPLVQPLLDAMRDQGVIALSAWPDDLRHPFAWEQNGTPVAKAADLQGAKIWALPSKLQSTILEGFGAQPFTAGSAKVDQMVADGSLRVAESSFNGIRTLSGTPTGTGDIVLYPKFQILAADDAAFSRLTDQQQAIVRGAALAARDLDVANRSTDAKLAREWCDQGGRVVLAGDAGVQSFRDAARPILAKLAEDPITKTAIDAIAAIKGRTAASGQPVAACRPVPTDDEPWPSAPPGPDLGYMPDGVYVHTVTERELRDAGVDPGDARANAGTWTLTIQGQHGTWSNSQNGQPGEAIGLDFELRGDHVRMQQHDHPSFWDVRWTFKDDVLDLELVGSDWNTALGAMTLNAYWKGAWEKAD
jgi:TRAP-type transport system periplasmic protein